MSDYREDIQKLFQAAELISDGLGKVAILEQAIQLADHHQDILFGYESRRRVLPACLEAGLPDTMLVSYAWCLAQCDRDPHNFTMDDILWEYRWVVSEMPTFPQITFAQVHEALADIHRRYEAAGSSMRAIWLLNVNVSISLKNRTRAEESLERWRAADRDRFSDDADTERAFQADFFFFTEQFDKAIAICDAIIRGRKSSEHFFGSDSADLLYPLLKTGRLDDAARCHKQGYRYVAWNPRYVDCCGDHLEYLALTDNWTRATRLAEKHWPVAMQVRKPNDRLAFIRALYVYAERFRLSGVTEVSLAVPTDFPGMASSGKCDLSALATWSRDQVTDWSNRYDLRNGNDWYARRLQRADADIRTDFRNMTS